MRNRTLVLIVVLLFLGSSSSCTLLKNKLTKDPNAIDVTFDPANVAGFDPKAPLVSPGAEVVRRLTKLDPSLAVFASDIEAVERSVMKKAIDNGLGQDRNEKGKEKEADKKYPSWLSKGSAIVSPNSPVKAKLVGSSSFAGLMMFQGGAVNSADRVHAAGLIGGLITGLKQIFSQSHTSTLSSGGVKDTKTETKNGTTTTMGAELSFQDDGSSVLGLELKTESVKDGTKVVAELTGKVEGLDCPNAEGQVPLTVKLRLGGESGGVGYTQDLTAFIRATVDDNADIATTTIDLVQGTREVNKGREVYVETGLTFHYEGDNAQDSTVSNWRLIRHSQSAVADEARAMAESGQESALAMAMTALAIAKDKWQNGGCVKIEATSPGSVAVSSTTQIPVKVIHKFGGGEVPSKVEATLSGEASVEPKLIARTAGTLTYVAPGETAKNATIKLKASSRRGRATLDLTASTGGAAYRIAGGLDDWQTNTDVCDIMKPFTLTGGGFTMQVSGGLSGTYTYSGPFNAHGTGTYTISLPEGIGKPGTMTGGGAGSAEGYTNTGTEKYTLTPITPCN